MSEKKSIQYKGITINYSVCGQGKAVVLLHGFGEDSRIWENQIPFLNNLCRLIVPDLPGSGESGLLPEADSIDHYADAVHAIVQKETISEFILIGHSMGGYITLAFVEKYPDIVSGFGLFHSSAYADDREKIETRKKGIEFIHQHGGEKFLEQSIPNLFSDETKRKNPLLIQEFITRYRNFSNEALVQYYEVMIKRPDRTGILRNTTKPVLFILGEWDTAIPLQKGLEQSTLPGICYIHILRHSGHLGMLEEPEICNKALKEFISDDFFTAL